MSLQHRELSRRQCYLEGLLAFGFFLANFRRDAVEDVVHVCTESKRSKTNTPKHTHQQHRTKVEIFKAYAYILFGVDRNYYNKQHDKGVYKRFRLCKIFAEDDDFIFN